MLRSEVKSIIILTLFSYLMWDYLTISTIGFSSLGLLLIAFKVPVPKHVRTLLVLGLFASYWVKYGKVIDPEIGLNFLTSVVILKLLEKENLRDSYMIFFGLILLLSAGALFEKTLTYVLFFTSSFAILLFDFYGTLLIKSRTRELFLGFLWVVPLTCVLFFAVPRLMSPISFRNGGAGPGEVGYTSNLRISEMESLEMSDLPAFQVAVDRQIPQEKLYWRGNVLIQNDGWNWSHANGNHLVFPAEKSVVKVPGTIRQRVRLFGKEEFYFGLDHPEKFLFGGNTTVPDDFRTLSQHANEWQPRYEVISRIDAGIKAEEIPDDKYLRVVLSRKMKDWVGETFPSKTLSGLRSDIQKYFQEEGFIYTLSPGKIQSFQEFIQNKKAGFCSHYASAVAIIMRTRGFPVRIVSGFMGGNFNRYASFYLITQNDAHVWLEVFENGQWQRVDPTAWIAPDRLALGGEAFLGSVTIGNSEILGNFRSRIGWIQDAVLWFNQWDFRFYSWLEEMDYYGQEAILSQFKFKRKWLYTFAPIMIGIFLALFAWQTRRRADSEGLGPHEKAWKEFVQKVGARGLLLVPISVRENEERLSSWNHPESEKFRSVWDKLVAYSFRSHEQVDWDKLRKEIRKL